jgi:hypothetical protein
MFNLEESTAKRRNNIDRKSEDRKQRFMRIYFIIFPIFYSVLGLAGILRIEMNVTERLFGFTAVASSAWFLWIMPHVA